VIRAALSVTSTRTVVLARAVSSGVIVMVYELMTGAYILWRHRAWGASRSLVTARTRWFARKTTRWNHTNQVRRQVNTLRTRLCGVVLSTVDGGRVTTDAARQWRAKGSLIDFGQCEKDADSVRGISAVDLKVSSEINCLAVRQPA